MSNVVEFEDLTESLVGRTIIEIEDSDDGELFFVLDNDLAFSVAYEEGEGVVLRLFERTDATLLN